MKIGVFFIFATNSVKGQRAGNRAVEEKKVDEIDYNAGNWLDVEVNFERSTHLKKNSI